LLTGNNDSGDFAERCGPPTGGAGEDTSNKYKLG